VFGVARPRPEGAGQRCAAPECVQLIFPRDKFGKWWYLVFPFTIYIMMFLYL